MTALFGCERGTARDALRVKHAVAVIQPEETDLIAICSLLMRADVESAPIETIRTT